MLLPICDHVCPAFELDKKFRIFSKADDVHIRHQSQIGHFKTYLVIAFAGSSMCHKGGVFLESNLDLLLAMRGLAGKCLKGIFLHT